MSLLLGNLYGFYFTFEWDTKNLGTLSPESTDLGILSSYQSWQKGYKMAKWKGTAQVLICISLVQLEVCLCWRNGNQQEWECCYVEKLKPVWQGNAAECVDKRESECTAVGDVKQSRHHGNQCKVSLQTENTAPVWSKSACHGHLAIHAYCCYSL